MTVGKEVATPRHFPNLVYFFKVIMSPEPVKKSTTLCRVAVAVSGSCHKRQKPQAPTPQAPVVTAKREKSQTPKVLTAILTLPNLT